MRRTLLILIIASWACRNPSAGGPFEPQPIEPRDAFYAVVGTSDAVVLAVGKYGKILRSTDGGASWHQTPSGVGQPLFSITSPHPGRTLVVGAKGVCLESSDDGATWTKCAVATDRHLFAAQFLDGRGLIAGEFGTLFRSDDAGKEWNRVEIEWEEMVPELAESFGSVEPHLYALAFCDPERVWIVGEYGLVLASEDGGKTWTKQRGGGLFDRHLFAAICLPAGSVLVAGQGGEIAYRAHGQTRWTSTTPGTTKDIYHLAFSAGPNEILALGDLGLMLTTSGNDLNTWKPAVRSNGSFGHPWLAHSLTASERLILAGEMGVAVVDRAALSHE